jgi:hypothetical protein
MEYQIAIILGSNLMDNKPNIPLYITTTMKPIELLGGFNKKEFNLCFYAYQGKLKSKIEVFNFHPIEKSIKIVKETVV